MSTAAALRNVEVKGRVRDLAAMLRLATLASDSKSPTAVLNQRDTYFVSAVGRLKLRHQRRRNATDTTEEQLQLVHYDRPDDSTSARLSEYRICDMNPDRADDMRLLLEAALGVRGEVIKERHLFMAGRTRIHVDDVRDLGTFFELEVVLRPDESLQDGQTEAKRLLAELEVDESDMLNGSYVDMILKGSKK